MNKLIQHVVVQPQHYPTVSTSITKARINQRPSINNKNRAIKVVPRHNLQSSTEIPPPIHQEVLTSNMVQHFRRLYHQAPTYLHGNIKGWIQQTSNNLQSNNTL